jgi:hypothetical protein
MMVNGALAGMLLIVVVLSPAEFINKSEGSNAHGHAIAFLSCFWYYCKGKLRAVDKVSNGSPSKVNQSGDDMLDSFVN